MTSLMRVTLWVYLFTCHVTHSANFDKKVHKPQSIRTLAVTKAKKQIMQKNKHLEFKYFFKYFNFLHVLLFFYPGAHNLSRHQKTQATLK